MSTPGTRPVRRPGLQPPKGLQLVLIPGIICLLASPALGQFAPLGNRYVVVASAGSDAENLAVEFVKTLESAGATSAEIRLVSDPSAAACRGEGFDLCVVLASSVTGTGLKLQAQLFDASLVHQRSLVQSGSLTQVMEVLQALALRIVAGDQGESLLRPDARTGGLGGMTLQIGSARFVFAAIPAGEFVMGCGPEAVVCRPDEQPAHRVVISKPFEITVSEVTQEQWREVMGNSPSDPRWADDTAPVNVVSWIEVEAFLGRLNERGDGYLYRLPTEAEWEYAARGPNFEAAPDLEAKAWYAANSGFRPSPVGLKSPTDWGLFDVLGNVWEWCNDWYSPDYYAISPTTDPQGPESGTFKVARGGGWGDTPTRVRTTTRYRNKPKGKVNIIGFRIVRQ